MSSGGSAGARTVLRGVDYYRILKLPRTATSSQIKDAYRKLALEHHPDFHGGCKIKLEEFKILTEAYETLRDRRRRDGYDREFFGPRRTQYGDMGGIDEDRWKKKVYAPRPPPNFKRFDHDKFNSYHYGHGLLEEEIAMARRRADEAAEAAGSKVEFQSPLGKEAIRDARRANGGGIYYTRTREGMSEGARIQRAKVAVVDRMNKRRAERLAGRKVAGDDDTGCSVM